MRATVTPQELEAALLCTSKDETRYVLNSVHFEFGPEALLVSTNGKILIAVRSKQVDEDAEATGSAILSSHFLNGVLTLAKAEKADFVSLSIRGTQARASILKDTKEACSLESGSAVIDGTYPNWRTVIPQAPERTVTDRIFAFNPGLLAPFAKANKLLGRKTGFLRVHLIDALSPVCVLDGVGDWFGILMLARMDDRSATRPDWLTAALKKKPSTQQEVK